MVFCRGILIIRLDASVQRRIGYLPRPGGECIFYRLVPCFPVIGIPDQRLDGRDHQQRQIVCVGQCVTVFIVVSADALVDQRRSNGADHVAVVVRAAQPFRRQHMRVHHNHIMQMP